jgi:hypothetical protein
LTVSAGSPPPPTFAPDGYGQTNGQTNGQPNGQTSGQTTGQAAAVTS